MMRAATASTELVERHRPEILRYLGRMLRDAGDAEDACQDVFLRAHRAVGRLRAESNVRAWLYRIATNRALNVRRSRARAMARAADVDVDALTAPAGSAEERADVDAVRRAVERLPSRQRAALVLRRFHGLDYTEVAATLGGSEAAARANVYQAVKKLRAALGETP